LPTSAFAAIDAHENGISAFPKVVAESTTRIAVCSVWSHGTTQANLFGYGRRILAESIGYTTERTLLYQLLFNVNSVREGKVLAVTFYLAAHKGLLSDRQITS
jgi:hypothetical protein